MKTETQEKHIWLSDEYSVPESSLCMHEPPSPNRDHRCVRAKGHTGGHEYMMATEPGFSRDYSWKDRRP